MHLGRTEQHVLLRLGYAECEMKPVTARQVARLLLDLADQVENESAG